jgi:septal ring factor EnvC (AmiA/AmiB activator)
MSADLIPTIVALCGAGGVLSTLIGWALGRRRRHIDIAKLATDIAAELLSEMRIEIDRLTERLTQAEHEADQLRAELAATRSELAALRNNRS